MFGDLNERQLVYVEQVLMASERLLSLINDVLDLAKIEDEGMELELSEVAISELLRSAVPMYSERASRGNVELSLTTKSEEITISADELDTIFEEFKQASNTRRAEGTGLGLPLSRKLVELHGGRVWVDGAAGKGSICRFTLPAVRACPFPSTKPATPTTSGDRSWEQLAGRQRIAREAEVHRGGQQTRCERG
jgi:signal transduction histidine kinase